MSCTPPEELVGYGSILEYKNPLTDAWVTAVSYTHLTLPTSDLV